MHWLLFATRRHPVVPLSHVQRTPSDLKDVKESSCIPETHPSRKEHIPSTFKIIPPFFSNTTPPSLPTFPKMMAARNLITPLLYLSFFTLLHYGIQPASGSTCRFYCGNITVGFPFSLQPGCGHPGFRNLLFCINGVLLLHIPSGSYRVLDINYAYRAITLHDPAMSDCYSLSLRSSGSSPKGNGFIVEPWRASYLTPSADNVFLLLGCRAESPLFQGFPERHLPCHNVSGMGCEEYYACPAWTGLRPRGGSSTYGSVSPPECCSVSFGEIRGINLTHLGCQGYSSAYSTAPLRPPGPGAWSYGIRASYSVPADDNAFRQDCEATGGASGYDTTTDGNLCLCEARNSTSNCDSAVSSMSNIKQSVSLASPISDLVIMCHQMGSCFHRGKLFLSSFAFNNVGRIGNYKMVWQWPPL